MWSFCGLFVHLSLGRLRSRFSIEMLHDGFIWDNTLHITTQFRNLTKRSQSRNFLIKVQNIKHNTNDSNASCRRWEAFFFFFWLQLCLASCNLFYIDTNYCVYSFILCLQSIVPFHKYWTHLWRHLYLGLVNKLIVINMGIQLYEDLKQTASSTISNVFWFAKPAWEESYTQL